MSVKNLSLIAVAAILGCAPATGISSTSDMPAVPRKANFLTAEEITTAHAENGTAYDALSRLRPNWLASRGAVSSNPEVSPFATVFVDGQRYGDLNSLRNIQASDVADMRYYSITEAGATFGLRGGTGGVIEIRMRVRD
jgi:hypothetical protein